MRVPAVHVADNVKDYSEMLKIGNMSVLYRPEATFIDWTKRWKLALDVFMGKADALYWKGQ